MIKKNIAVIIFLIVTCCSVLFLDKLLSIKSSDGIIQARAMYYQPQDTIDVVMLGSSHIHCDINTALLWKDYGIAAYDYSAAEQPLWETYYYLREICRYQKPKVVVLDLYSPARFKEDYQYYWLNDNLSGMRFSLNKLQMLADSSEPELYDRYFPSFVTYHSRYSDLTMEDLEAVFNRKDMVNFKGFTPYLETQEQKEPDLEETNSGGITLKSEIFLSKIIDYTRENGIELYLVVTPYITTDDDELVYNRVKEIAEDKGIEFNSSNYDYDEMEIDFEADFCDSSHLNYMGSCKFSAYLAKQLKQLYDIPDRRGQEGYESWDRSAQIVEDYVAGRRENLY